VAEQADALLKQMSTYVGSAEQFTFHADITFDHVLPSGQKVQFAAVEDVALHRPGRLRVDWSGDLGDRVFWYDGKSATIYDPSMPFYASEPMPGEIDGMLDTVPTKLGFSPRWLTSSMAIHTEASARKCNMDWTWARPT
jgi:hypothetical protein